MIITALRKMKALALALATMMLSACYYLQSTSIPIKYETHSNTSLAAKSLVVFLPGIRDYGSGFEKNGFINLLHASAPNIDAITVEAHFKYYQERSLLLRLREDIILPAKEKGYERIHLVGISLGGLGALLYLKEHSEDITSVFVLAPYLGEEKEYAHLRTPDNTKLAAETTESEIDIWPWLTTLPPETKQKIYLSYGEQDKFQEANALMASYIEDNHYFTAEGGHDWPTWKRLWKSFLEKGQFQ